MVKIYKHLKYLSEKYHSAFTVFLLLLSFLGSNIYYYLTFDYITDLQNPNTFYKPNTKQNMLFNTRWVDVSKELLANSSPEIDVTDAMLVCEYWRKQAEKDNSWPSRLKANEECVNAILQHLAKIEGAGAGQKNPP